MLREGQEVAVKQLTEEMSELLAEVETELNAFLEMELDPPAPAGRRPEETPQQQQQDKRRRPEASAAAAAAASSSSSNGAAALELSAASPRQSYALPTAAASPSSSAAAALAPLRRRSPPELSLLLPPASAAAVAAAAATGGGGAAAAAVVPAAGAGDRAERRRRKWQRRGGGGGAGVAAPLDEARYTASGKSSMGLLLGSFTRDRMLTPEEERVLAAACQDSMGLQDCRRMLASMMGREPSMEELAEVLKTDATSLRVRLDAGHRARSMLAQKNYRYVVSTAKGLVRSMGSALSAAGDGGSPPSGLLDDAVAAGMEGLMRAVVRFDPTAGVRLTTYATGAIRQCIWRHLQAQAGAITMPMSKREAIARLNRTRAALVRADPLGRQPSREALAAALGLGVQEVAALEALSRAGVRSLDAPLSEGEPGRTAVDLISQEDEEGLGEGSGSTLSVDSEEAFAGADLAATVDSLLGSLDERDAQAVRFSFGLGLGAAGAAGEPGGPGGPGGGTAGAGLDLGLAVGAVDLVDPFKRPPPRGQGRPRRGVAEAAARLKLGSPTSAAARAQHALVKLRQRSAEEGSPLVDRLSDYLEDGEGGGGALRRELPVRAAPGYTKKSH